MASTTWASASSRTGPDRVVLGVLGGGTGQQVTELPWVWPSSATSRCRASSSVDRSRRVPPRTPGPRSAISSRASSGPSSARSASHARARRERIRPWTLPSDAPQLARAGVRPVRLGGQSRVPEGLGGEVGEGRVVVLLGPVPGDLGGLQAPLGGRAVLAQLAQAVAEPPLRLHDRPVAVRLGVQVGQRRLQHLRGLGPPALPQQEPAELLPGPGAQRRPLAGLVGPVRGLQGVLGGLLGSAPAADDLGELEVQLGPPDRLQVLPAVLQGRPQRPLRLRPGRRGGGRARPAGPRTPPRTTAAPPPRTPPRPPRTAPRPSPRPRPARPAPPSIACASATRAASRTSSPVRPSTSASTSRTAGLGLGEDRPFALTVSCTRRSQDPRPAHQHRRRLRVCPCRPRRTGRGPRRRARRPP